jgi:hypothetical protein
MWNCMMCGKPSLDTPRGAEIEPNVYNEYQELKTVKWIAWVYCKSCDAWTQHPILEDK